MFRELNSFLNYCINKKVAFIGIGVSNFKAIVMFLKKGINVTVLDRKSEAELGVKANILKEAGAKFICGENYLSNILNFNIVIRSPGVYFNCNMLQNAIKKGVVVTSEMELFFDFCPCKIIAITGSDGKTTTTTIIASILKQEGFNVHVGGNIGKPLLCELQNINRDDVCVVELSSFQLLSMRKSPDIAVITNISKNHLDVHKSMDEYIKAKQNIFIHQNAFSKVILNLDSNICCCFENYARGFVEKFSMKGKVLNGAFYDEDSRNLYSAKNGEYEKILSSNDIKLLGTHNIENFLAAIAATFNMASSNSIKKVAKEFKGVKHRLELIKSSDNIYWYNDSIATTPTRTIAALNSFKNDIILIAGGYDKKVPFDGLITEILKKVKTLILMGATANKIENGIKNNSNFRNNFNILKARSVNDAVVKAKEIAKRGDVILFSPACASFDMYNNFEERGEDFVNSVLKL